MNNDIIEEYCTTSDEQRASELLSIIYLEYNRMIFRILLKFISYEDAQEVLQDCFLKLHTNRKKIRAKDKKVIASWLKKVASNMAITIYRRKKSKKHPQIESTEDIEENGSFDEITLIWSLVVYDFIVSCIEMLKIFESKLIQKIVFLHEISNLHMDKKSRYKGSGLDYTKYRTNLWHAEKTIKEHYNSLYTCVENKTWRNG